MKSWEVTKHGYLRMWKAITFTIILALFLVQSFFVYSDYKSPVKHVPLSRRAVAGLKLWRSNNCQVCHQVYGFGGFLGPDLTNVASRLDPIAFERILTYGQKQMPAFGLDKEKVNSLVAFFDELDATGRGFAVLPNSDSIDHLKAAIEEHDSASTQTQKISQAIGQLKSYGCTSCHKPFEEFIGPDLTLVMKRRDRRYIAHNILVGRGNMPAFPNIKKEEIELLLDGLEYLSRHRDRLHRLTKEKREKVYLSFNRLPWYEF